MKRLNRYDHWQMQSGNLIRIKEMSHNYLHTTLTLVKKRALKEILNLNEIHVPHFTSWVKAFEEEVEFREKEWKESIANAPSLEFYY